MSLRAYRQTFVNVLGDGSATTVSFDLRDVCVISDHSAALLNSPPISVVATSPFGAIVQEHSRYNVTLSFATAPTVAQVSLQLFY